MTQDLYYYESGYIDESYFVYTADAESQTTSESTISCDASVIAGGAIVLGYGDIQSFATISCTISHINGADLFAFTEATLAAQVDRIRDNNVQLSTQFDVAVTAVRGIYVQAQADSQSSIIISGSRSTNLEAAANAAFSLDVTFGKIIGVSSYENSAFTPTLTVDVFKNSFAVLDSVSSTVVSAIVNKTLNVNATSLTSLSINPSIIGTINSSIESAFVEVASANRAGRYITVDKINSSGIYTPVEITNISAKFGSHSLYSYNRNAQTMQIQNLCFGPDELISVNVGTTWKSLDNGATWTSYVNNFTLSGSASSAHKIFYMHDRYWSSGSGFNSYSTRRQLKYSFDGITWTTLTSVSSYATDRIGYLNGLWFVLSRSTVATNTTGYHIVTSPDLINWTQRTTLATYYFSGVPAQPSHNVNICAIVCDSTTAKIIIKGNDYGRGVEGIYSSTDATTWTRDITLSPTFNNDVDYNLDVENNNWVLGLSGQTSTNKYIYGSKQGNSSWIINDTNILRGTAVLANGKFTYNGKISSNFGTTWTPLPWDVEFTTKNNLKPYGLKYNNGSIVSTSDGLYFDETIVPGNSNVRGSISYSKSNNSNWNNWGTIDFWVKFDGYDVYAQRFFGTDSWHLYYNDGVLRFIDLTNNVGTSNAVFYTSAWNHVRIVRLSSQIAIYVNGSRKLLTSLINTNYYDSEFTFFKTLVNQTNNWVEKNIFLDAIHISSNQVNDPSLTSITIPTVAPTETAYTIGLFNFNDTLQEDRTYIVISRLGDAALSVESQLSSNLSVLRNTSSNLYSTVNFLTTANKLSLINAQLQSQGFVVVAGGRIRPFVDIEVSTSSLDINPVKTTDIDASITSIANVACDATRNIGPITSDQTVESSIVINPTVNTGNVINLEAYAGTLAAAGRIQPSVAELITNTSINVDAFKSIESRGDASCESSLNLVPTKLFGNVESTASAITSLTARAVAIPAGGVNMPVEAIQTLTPTRVRYNRSDVTATTNLDLDGDVIRRLSGNLSSYANTEINALRIKQLQTQFTAIFSELAISAKIGDFLIDCAVDTTLTVDAGVKQSNSATFESATNLDVSTKVNKPFSANLQVSAFEFAFAEAGIISGANCVVTTTMSAEAVVISSERADLTTTSSLVCNLTQTKQGIAIEMSFGTMAISGDRTRSTESHSNVTSTLAIQAGKVEQLSAGLAVEGFTLVIGKVINLQASEVWIVPSDNYYWIVPAETTLYTIESEDRTYLIED